MMTSVTLPSSTGPMHASFAQGVSDSGPNDALANVNVDEERQRASPSEDFEPPRAIAPEPLRAAKRCLDGITANVGLAANGGGISDPYKKRRKQATPVRISAADSPPSAPTPYTPPINEGKLPNPSPDSPAISESKCCPVCQMSFGTMDQLQAHISAEHINFECKLEPVESPVPPTSADHQVPPSSSNQEQHTTSKTTDIPWMSDIPNKEWLNPNLITFTPTNHMFMGLTPYTPHDSMPPRQPIRIFNPDAYCELCNKEFCNKYFLKTHKANKHGIYTDQPSSEPASMSSAVNIPSFVSNMKLPTSLPSVDISPIKFESKTMITPYPDIYSNPFGKTFHKMDKPNNSSNADSNSTENIHLLTPSNGISNNCEPNDQRSLSEDPTNEGSISPRPVQYDAAMPKQDNNASEQETLYYTSPSKLSPTEQARELERLRKLGVMNPKAFCEICCKEYCNKYFLRTHKLKRHGIYIPDDREKDLKMENFHPSYMQTSPLNLIMAEQSKHCSDLERKTMSPPDISCDICCIKFQNIGLFQLHNISVHSKLQNNDNNNEKRSTVEGGGGVEKSADSISEDLQKLQTMIMQLNDLDVNKASTTCAACNKEFENRYYLHAHMMTEHGLLIDDNGEIQKAGESETSINNNNMCDLCGKDFHSYEEMKKHMNDVHVSHQGSTPERKDEFPSNLCTSDKSGSRPIVVGNGSLGDRRPSMNLTPTSSYCEICNKELCNKYFMKTHMQRMHGIEIENGAQIGGVVCDICNKELCSKYFLRVHKHNTHGIVEYGASLLQPPRKGDDGSVSLQGSSDSDPALKPTDLADLSHRYFTHFTEVCTICNRRFRSTKWLKAHLLSDHGQAGADKWAEVEQQLQHTMNKSVVGSVSVKLQGDSSSPTLKIPNSGPETSLLQQKVGLHNVLSSIFGADETSTKSYQCSYCSFTTPVLPFLFVHERSHTIQSSDVDSKSLKCPVCPQSFSQPDLMQHHLFSQHPLLPLPPFFNGNAESVGDVSKEPSESAEDNEDTGSISDKAIVSKPKKPPGVKYNTSSLTGALSTDIDQTLKDLARKVQLPVVYALPQPYNQTEGNHSGICGTVNNSSGGVGEENTSNTSRSPTRQLNASYTMQAFLVEENLTAPDVQPKFVPSVVFLPVLQKISTPMTATFTLTPA